MESLYDFLIGAIVDTDLAIEGFATGAWYKFEGTGCSVVLHNLCFRLVLNSTVAHGLSRHFFRCHLVPVHWH
jgi:hypothetical protein